MDAKKILKIFIPLLIGAGIAMLTPPEGLTEKAMIFMGIFLCVLIWLVLEPFPDYIVIVLAMMALPVFKVADLRTALAPFSQSAVWLVIGAFGISAVVSKTGLLKRIALSILRYFPESFSGQIMALITTGVVISPLIPSVTAKASIMAPFAAATSASLGYAKSSKGAAGLFAATWVSSGIFGYAFLSGAVPVYTIIGMLPEAERGAYTWGYWFALCCVWLAIMIVLTFGSIMLLYRPGKGQDAAVTAEKGFAQKSLRALGPMSRDEKVSAAFLCLALVGWMTAPFHKIDSGVWAIIILCFMIMAGLLSSAEFTSKIAWPVVFFIGGLFSLAAMVSTLKIHTWMASVLGPVLSPVMSSPFILVPAVCISCYLIRVVVLSQTANLAIYFAIFSGLAQSAGQLWMVLFVAYISSLVWHFYFTNGTYVAAIGATNKSMVEHRDNQPMNIAFMVINLIAFMVSIPLWYAIGIIK